MSLDELLALARNPALGHPAVDPTGGGWVLVEAAGDDAALPDDDLAAIHALPVVLVGPASVHDAVDVVVADDDEAAVVTAAVDARPAAATALALLLRGGDRRTVGAGLVAESSTYSMLQAGAEHRAWLAGRPTRPARPPGAAPAVRVEREGPSLRVTLARPEVRNAFDAATRDGLLEALAIATADPSIADVVLAGEGPSFCSGGDLDEFGTAADPAAAHLVRLARSAGWAIHQLAPKVTAHLHGACIGAGIELPAFAGRVVARADATFALPEVGMGLVPGAGGTVSIPRRIGRHRTLWLALTGEPVDASTALAWGLVDEVVELTN